MKSNQKSAIYNQITQAHEAHKAGYLNKAQAVYEEILSLDSSNFDALHMLGVVHAQMNQPQKAIELLKKASVIEPNHAILQFNLANAYKKIGGRPEIAKKHFQRAINLDQNYLDALINLGDLHLDLKEPHLSIDCFLQATKINPKSVLAQIGLGRSYLAAENKNLSQQAYEKALELSVDSSKSKALNERALEALMDIGISLHILGNPEKALQAFNKILDISSNHEKALFHKAIAFRAMNQLNEALETFNELYQLNSENLEAIQGLAITFLDIGRKAEALVCAKRALELSPDLATAHDTMGVILNSVKDFNQSIQHHLRAIELNPKTSDFYLNLGFSLLSVNQINEAKIAFSEAIRIDPNAKKASWNLSAALLKLNEFDDGWKHYATRWQLPELNLKPLVTEKPSWTPNSNSKHLLVWGEQGIGDEIMFDSLLDQLCSRLTTFTLYTVKRLAPLIQRSFPNIRCISEASELEGLDYDYQISIGDLPKYFCKSPNDFAKIRSPYLQSNQPLRNQIVNRYKKAGKVLCGISWKSNNPKLGPDRSIELKEFIASINIPEFEFINLQYGDVSHEIDIVKQELGINILQAEEIDNFGDIDGFAALIDACDLIISIDNSTVHIAGALGKPVWILLNTNPDWRWFLDRPDSLWYPSATLFRQTIPGQWQPALKQVKDKAIAIINGNVNA